MYLGLQGFERFAPRTGTMDGVSNQYAFGGGTMDAQVSGGMTFLQAELEKVSPTLIEPIASVTFQRDIPIEVGGGWLDYTSNFFASYGTTGNSMFGIQANQNSNVARAQADVTKDLYSLYAWQASISIKFIDMQKLQNTPRSVRGLFESSVRLNWNLAQNEMCYTGLMKEGIPVYGIVNDPNVPVTTAAAVGSQNGATNSTLWVNKTPQQVAADVFALLNAQWAYVQYAPDAMINHIGLSPAKWQYLAGMNMAINGTAIAQTLLQFIEQNNAAAQQGRPVKIVPMRQCIGAGTGGTDRMVGYVNDEAKLVMPITVPMTQAMAVPNILNTGGSYETLYAAQIGAPKKLMPQGFAYLDGI